MCPKPTKVVPYIPKCNHLIRIAMNKIIYFIACLGCLIFPVSCLTTLQPLITIKNVITDDRITGNWQYDKGTIQIKRLGDKSMKGDFNDYRISPRIFTGLDNKDSAFYKKAYNIYFENNGIGYNMIGAITRIKDDLFIEISPILINDPQRREGSGYEFTYYYQPGFTIAKLTIKDNQSIHLQFLHGDFIKEQIKIGNMRIKHEQDPLFNTFVITASSTELQQFFEKYGNDERLFSPKYSITLNRKGNI